MTFLLHPELWPEMWQNIFGTMNINILWSWLPSDIVLAITAVLGILLVVALKRAIFN